ncbi:aminotransferase class V-fold PLP-dependent enzyme [Corynebacterium glyciniphilum]|uniref:aminotransferase class V-fold PLP-dependent enzyme n=1 Tax=Corynebacterium glyciniphilum TaxID=1404244 RepID=UPI00265112F3|nr:aminotransferase class V-fold PLP-dependent enzyme [Corynebacterium glyciniphilum]MDN5684523.1 aminotransferase class V-fold PLP-dependent enzyme [Corynebacterium glyciniphilum]
MNLPHNDIDPDGLLEYSVVFTDRSLNHMSARFTKVMQDIRDILRTTYDAATVAVVPGGGSYAMEAVARQLVTGKRALIVRNGLFSFRWSQIIDAGRITDDVTVLKARQTGDEPTSTWVPAPIEDVTAAIRRERPEVVIAPHVETAAGIQLTDSYITAMAKAAHEVDALVVLDCVASGASWVSMTDTGVDVLVSAPQKGWSGTPCAGYVMLSEAGRDAVNDSTSTSFAVDLKKWLFITDEYGEGRTPYHATLPTDGLAHNAELMAEARDRGLENLRAAQIDLGTKVRALLAEHDITTISSGEFAAPSVVVAYTDDPAVKSGAKFKEAGVQVAGSVPLQCGEPEDFSTFRLGLFGLDKLADVDGTVERLRSALEKLGM